MITAMLHAFMNTLTGECGVGAGQAVLACCSGGIDSMVLLDLLVQASGPLRLKVGVVHVDHGIRKDATDASFVSGRCRGLGIPCHVYPLSLSRGEPNLEEKARLGRYARIRECMGAHGYDAAATGHTLDDQAETILYRIIRGSGIRGMGGMEHRGEGGLVRPLIGFTRGEIEAYAGERGIPHVEDCTNEDTTIARNLIRHEIIPLMKRINPEVAVSVARLGRIAREEGGYVENLSLRLECDARVLDWGAVRAYRLDKLREAPKAVLKRLVIRVLSALVDEPRGVDAVQVQGVVDVIEGRKAGHTVKRRVTARIDGDGLVFFPAGPGPFYGLDIRESGVYRITPLNVEVRITGRLSGAMRLTSPSKGARIGGKRVVRLLAERGVMAALRPFWPVLVSGGEVVSVAGLLDSQAGPTTEFPLAGQG